VSEELKTCPLCGSEVTFELNRDVDGYANPEFVCQGDDCSVGVQLGTYGEGFSDDEVERMCLEIWNRRPTEDALAARVTELERIVADMAERHGVQP
jgi:hypothetical protein